MKRIIALIICAIFVLSTITISYAEEATSDVLDSSAELKEAQENGIPTEAMVNELKEEADALYAKEKWEEAAIAYYDTARKANYLANIMSQCGEPYYSSSSENRNIPDRIYDDLVALENKSNTLKKLRNTCYVYEGICYNKMGESEIALATLYNALDIISYSESEIWSLASEELMSIIQYSSDEKTASKKEMRSYIGKPYSEFEAKYGKAKSSYIYKSLGETSYDYDNATVYVDTNTRIIKDMSVY